MRVVKVGVFFCHTVLQHKAVSTIIYARVAGYHLPVHFSSDVQTFLAKIFPTSGVDTSTMLTDYLQMFFFANASDSKLVNRPKMSVFVILYKNQEKNFTSHTARQQYQRIPEV